MSRDSYIKNRYTLSLLTAFPWRSETEKCLRPSTAINARRHRPRCRSWISAKSLLHYSRHFKHHTLFSLYAFNNALFIHHFSTRVFTCRNTSHTHTSNTRDATRFPKRGTRSVSRERELSFAASFRASKWSSGRSWGRISSSRAFHRRTIPSIRD